MSVAEPDHRLAPPPDAWPPRVSLDPPHTQAGALERLFLAETQMPSRPR